MQFNARLYVAEWHGVRSVVINGICKIFVKLCEILKGTCFATITDISDMIFVPKIKVTQEYRVKVTNKGNTGKGNTGKNKGNK